MQNIFSHITWRPSRKLIVSLGVVCLILGGAYIWASRYTIDAMRLNNIRNSHLAYYSGCEDLNPSRVDNDIVNEYWNMNSHESNFNHADVVEYMMKRCPPKSDVQIEAAYAYLLDGTNRYPDMNKRRQERLMRINGAKSVRDYQLKFINKDFSVFQEDLKNGK
jgi:hypothetical protein